MGHVIVIQRDGAGASFEARQDELRAQGATLGEALDGLLDQMGELDEPLLLVPQDRPDRFFSQAEFDRLKSLQARAKEEGEQLTDVESGELRDLIAREFRATIRRTDSLVSQAA